MFLKGQTICLRALEPSDADLLYKWENDPALWPVSFTQLPFSKFILEEFVNAAYNDIYTNRQLRLMACRLEDMRPAGLIDLFDFEPQHARCGLGIYVNEDFRRKGYAAECLALMKDYCFNTLHLRQVYAHVSATNASSLALFEKAGFEKSGLKKCWNKTGINTFEDVWFLQCLHPVA
jgi:diamine N-acetyltransferase